VDTTTGWTFGRTEVFHAPVGIVEPCSVSRPALALVNIPAPF